MKYWEFFYNGDFIRYEYDILKGFSLYVNGLLLAKNSGLLGDSDLSCNYNGKIYSTYMKISLLSTYLTISCNGVHIYNSKDFTHFFPDLIYIAVIVALIPFSFFSFF